MEENVHTEFKMKTTLRKLNKLPNGLLTQTLHAMDDYCDYLMDYRLYDLYDEDMLAIIFKGKSPLDLITLGLHAGQNQEFYLTDKYLAVNYGIDKVWTVSESNSDEYYKDRGYDWADILERLIEIFNYSDSFKNYLPSEVVNILKRIGA